ncbi:heme exporter protein CcmD [Psychromonas sp. MME2]|uniref:heme exporter protein CcmD n=1 Tax=unclassified Psychromonas TaxID=2614957 RepID=UPI00339BB821
MAFSSISDFFAMGGYAFYVWLAYGISFLALLVLIINTRAKKKKILVTVKQRLLRQQRIKDAQNVEGSL